MIEDFDLVSAYPSGLPINGCFIVENIITNSNKTIRIFDYPVPVGTTRDLLKIPGISESNIRVSLLKGELRNKILAKEIKIICSDIDLLQFNTSQKQFLMNAGVIDGLESSGGSVDESSIYHRDMILVGLTNNINTNFTLPSPDTIFIFSGEKKIIVYTNGVKQAISDDYMIAESGGPGTGYDVVIFINDSIPQDGDLITADYYIS